MRTDITRPDRLQPIQGLFLFMLAMVSHPDGASAEWSTNPAINNAVCTDYYNQGEVQMTSDGSGGAILTWVDHRFGSDRTIFAQRIDSAGLTQWTADGVQVSPPGFITGRPSIASDGNGGAIIVWGDGGFFGSVYVQHVSAGGELQWDPNGVLICDATADESIHQVASDGAGGAFIAWGDFRHGDSLSDDVFAQRVNSAGAIQWIANGVAVCNEAGFQGDVKMTSDGTGGAIAVWTDTRPGTFVAVYAQRMNAFGGMQWAANGVRVVSTGGFGSLYPQLINDAGAAIFCWVDRRTGNTDWNIYAQKVSAAGGTLWTENGEAICIKTGNQSEPRLTSDGNGGAILTWDEPVSAQNPSPDLFAQRVNAGGAVQWAENGVGVSLAAFGQRLPQLASDGNGGAVITWQDARNGNVQDIYAQRVNANGSAQWTDDGVAVSTATFVQLDARIVNDGMNGVIVAWSDYRNDLGANRRDVFAQRVGADGALGGASSVSVDDLDVPASFTLRQNYPNPFNSTTTIAYQLSARNHVTLKVYDVSGREVATLVDGVQAPGNKAVNLNASALASGVYLYRLQTGSMVETRELVVLR